MGMEKLWRDSCWGGQGRNLLREFSELNFDLVKCCRIY